MCGRPDVASVEVDSLAVEARATWETRERPMH